MAAFAAPVAAQQRPVIERVEPTSGPPGTEVQLIGRHLAPQSRIFLGGAELTVSRRLPNRWTVEVPAGARSGRIEIRTRAGRFSGPRFAVTASRPAPVIESLVPTTAAPGAEVVIHGQNFSPRIADNRVALGDRPVVVRSATTTTLTVVVPVGATTGPFVVQVAQAGEVRSEPLAVAVGTAITDFTPRVGPPGTEITINGTGFSTNRRHNRLFLNNRPLRVRSATPTQLVAQLPRTSASGPILLDVRGGGRAESAEPFTIQYTPVVRSFRPAAAPPGSIVTIRGANFGADPRHVRVTLNGHPAVLRRVIPNEIQVEIPAGATGGKLEVTVGTLGPIASREDLTVLVPVALTNFTPRSGGVGAVVTITGQGFSADPRNNRVTLSGANAEVIAVTPTELQVRIPSASSGPLLVRVTENGEARTAAPFVVTQPPTVTSFEPAVAAVGSQVTIRGTHFGTSRGLVSVAINGRDMPIRTLESDRLVVTVPPRATSGPIRVAVRLQGAAQSTDPLRVTAALGVSSVSPASGFVGTTVVIRGSGFAEGVTVTFPGAEPVAPATVDGDEIHVLVPEGAGTGPVTVRAAGASVLTPRPFTVEPTPEGLGITDYQATCSRPGCRVIIRGHGFDARARRNRITIGGQPVRVQSATATELVVTIPRVTGTHPFELKIRNVGEVSSRPLVVEP